MLYQSVKIPDGGNIMSPYSKTNFIESGANKKVTYDDYLATYELALQSDYEDFREVMEYFDPLSD